MLCCRYEILRRRAETTPDRPWMGYHGLLLESSGPAPILWKSYREVRFLQTTVISPFLLFVIPVTLFCSLLENTACCAINYQQSSTQLLLCFRSTTKSLAWHTICVTVACRFPRHHTKIMKAIPAIRMWLSGRKIIPFGLRPNWQVSDYHQERLCFFAARPSCDGQQGETPFDSLCDEKSAYEEFPDWQCVVILRQRRSLAIPLFHYTQKRLRRNWF